VVDGIDIVVTGQKSYTTMVRDGRIEHDFPNPDHVPLEVMIYLPTIMSVAVGNLETNGTLSPADSRPYLLALGDSITQGFVVGSPSLAWPAVVAARMGLDVVNQGVAGYTFDRASLRGLSVMRGAPPAAITVAYGTNDWSRKPTARAIRQDAQRYLDKLAWYFPNTPIYVVSPLWRADVESGAPSGVELTWVGSMLRNCCDAHPNMYYVEGYDAIPENPVMLADGYLHPGPVAAGLVAERVMSVVSQTFVPLSAAAAGLIDEDGEDAKGATDGDATAAGSGDDAPQAAPDKTVAAGTRVPKSGRAVAEPAGEIVLASEDVFDADESPLEIELGPIERVDDETRARVGAPRTHVEFDRLVRTIWRLRQPDGCAWDQAQTHESITRNMIEEAYEAVESIAEGNPDHLREELGDVLEQVLLHSQIASDEGEFDIDDVCRELNEKLVRRHPHVFGTDGRGPGGSGGSERGADSADAVLDIWDDVKKAERARRGEAERPEGLLDSVPKSLPALMQCQKISKRAAKVGFEWATVDDVWRQVVSEREEFEAEDRGSAEAVEEFGDILFALVNVARHEGIDAEEALAASNRKFRRRWGRMEAHAREMDSDLSNLDTDSLNELWDYVKDEERGILDDEEE
jgi:tetrapyrrole methylase family protein/MazG family protein